MLGAAEVSIPANGGEREEGSVVFGASSDRSSLLAGVSWNDREIIFARDLPWDPLVLLFMVTASPPSPMVLITLTGLLTNGGCDFPGTGFYTVPNPVNATQWNPLCL